MISAGDLMSIKRRMLMAAEINQYLATSDGEFLELDEETFTAANQAMKALRDDCQRVFGELDVLRGMFAERVSAFLTEGLADGVKNERAAVSDDPRTVADVRDTPVQGGGGSVRDDEAATGGPVRAGGPDGERKERPKSRRNRRKGGMDQEQVGRSD